MKRTLIALALIAVAGCAELPESLKQPLAARGATTPTDTQDVASTTPPASPYGN